ncbi:MAG: type VI secretion system Vgr family protein [Pseudomonadota bacterium]
MIDELLSAAGVFGRLDDTTRLFRLEPEGPLAGLAVESWALREALDEPWQMVLQCLGPDAGLDPAGMLDQPLTLWTRLADGSEHPRSGLVTAAASLGGDGGLARYELTVEPWLALLGFSCHSRVWQDKTVTEVIDAVFGTCGVAAWRWSDCVAPWLEASAHGGLRPCTVQYRETDLGFVRRLLAREGLGCRFEEDPDAPLGHTLVLFADSASRASCPEDAVSAGALGGVRYHASGAIRAQDAVQAFGGVRRLPVAEVAVLAWDEQAKRAYAAELPTVAEFAADGAPRLAEYTLPGVAGGVHAGSTQAERDALLRQQTHEARHKHWLGRGTVRSFTAGRFFRLQGSELDLLGLLDAGTAPEERTRFLLSRVTHAGINNLPGHPSAAAAKLLPEWVEPAVRAQAAATGYGNSFQALRASVPWRPAPRPALQAPGPLTATVVGPEGQCEASGADELHMDAQGRIRIAFDFQRAFQGPATSASSLWVRVLQRWAGAGMGAQFIPRIGQQVLVDFFDACLEQPVVIGALYDGQGEAGLPPTPGGQAAEPDTTALGGSTDHRPSAQGNLVAGGHAPAWHGAGAAALEAGGQANAAALSGYKSKEFGGEGFNQLVFDDSDRQLRTQLATTQHASQLNLGHLVHQADNHRGSLRGLGWELRTDAYGAVRANAGLHLSTYGTSQPEPAGDNAAGIALQGQLKTLAEGFSQAAGTHQAVALAAAQGVSGTRPSLLSDSEAPLPAAHTVLKGMVDGLHFDTARADAAQRATATSEGKLPHSADALISLAARGGLLATAGQDWQWSAGQTITLGSGQDTHLATGGAARIHTGQAIGILGGAIQPGAGAQGEAAGSGITLVAAQGDLVAQAQAGTMQIAAQGDVSIQSQSAHIDWAAAKKIVLQTAGGASVTLEGGNITVECPGKILVQAGMKSFTGGERHSYTMPALAKGELQFTGRYAFSL